MEDLTLKIGLLMEAAQSQQALAATTLERLREHAAGLDAIVREEIRSTLVDELQALGEDSRAAVRALKGLKRAARLHSLLWSALLAGLMTAIPLGLSWWLLPNRTDLDALRTTRDELRASVARLGERGGRAQLRRCGAERRLCVRVDRALPSYGETADYLVIKGY